MRGNRVTKIQRKIKDYGKDWSDSYQSDVKALGGRCEQCNCGNSFANPLQRHHTLGKRRGQNDSLAGLQLLCRRCHNLKHGK